MTFKIAGVQMDIALASADANFASMQQGKNTSACNGWDVLTQHRSMKLKLVIFPLTVSRRRTLFA